MRWRGFWVATAVLIATTARAEVPTTKPRPTRVFLRARTAWLWSQPDSRSRRLGYARGGTPLALRVEAVGTRGPGCDGAYYPVAPRGWVCGDDGTFDDTDRAYRVERVLGSHRPFRYAISNGAPMYRRLPTPEEWQRAERDLGPVGSYKRYPWNEKHERLAEDVAVSASDEVPFFLRGAGSARRSEESQLLRMLAPLGTMLAYVRAFDHAGRTWLLTTDGAVVPADRARPYRVSSFRGVALDGTTRLPLAWPRSADAQRLRLDASGAPVPAGGVWRVRDSLALGGSGEPHVIAGRRLFETNERSEDGSPLYVDASAVAVARREAPPARVSPGSKWAVVHVREGTLVAYEGAQPVFATLVSPGAGGVSREGVDPVRASTTPRGSYRLQYKYRSQTMSPQKDKPTTERTFWIDEVPHAQYFSIPFALHTSYWHESFGEWMSGGCVNLSPEDGAWLFGWTDPELPEGWDAVWAGGDNGRGTVVVIAR